MANKITGCVFDLDGTLIDSAKSLPLVGNKILMIYLKDILKILFRRNKLNYKDFEFIS